MKGRESWDRYWSLTSSPSALRAALQAINGKVRLFLVLENYPAADNAESLYEDMGFLKVHADHIERLAVVGDRIWQETWIALFGLFSGMETAYFDRADMEKAKKMDQ